MQRIKIRHYQCAAKPADMTFSVRFTLHYGIEFLVMPCCFVRLVLSIFSLCNSLIHTKAAADS